MKKIHGLLLLLSTIILLLATPIFLLVCSFALPQQYGDTFVGALKDKCERLDTLEGRRIVILGGSSVAFGIDSAMLEQAFPQYEVVNFGMYAALGTQAMLELSVDSIRAGDIVIVSPEQNAQALSDYFGAETMWQAADGAFSLLTRLDSRHWGSMAGQLPYFAARKAAYVLSGESPVITGVYTRANFNTYGDLAADIAASNTMPDMVDTNMPILFSADVLSDEFVETLNAYTGTLTARGAAVWYRFCPMNALAVAPESDIATYFDLLKSKLQCEIIGNPNASILAPEWFYDTNFHLNTSGKILNTRNLVRDIKAMLGDSSPTEITLPPPPTPLDSQAGGGDNSDSDCFTYEISGGAIRLTGLTKRGASEQNLTLPTVINGMPVTALASTVFAGNTTVRTVTVQSNISLIENASFDGCIQLRQIVMLQEKPSDCRIGQSFLVGTSSLVAVPPEHVNAYKLDYFWAALADRIIPFSK